MIDVLPGVRPNVIVPDVRSPVPVAVLSTADFDATTIDRSSLRFEDAAPRWSTLYDMNKDGPLDLIALFRVSDTTIACGDTTTT